MPRLYIENEYSHMGGLELLQLNKPYLHNEIRTILSTEIPGQTKISKDAGRRKGTLVWSGPAFNKPLAASFKRLDWGKKKFGLSNNRSVIMDFYKECVGLEVQFGKYAFVDTDFSKFEIFFHQNIVDLCVEVVPSHDLKRKMYSGVPDIEQVISRIQAKGRNIKVTGIQGDKISKSNNKICWYELLGTEKEYELLKTFVNGRVPILGP